MTEKQLAEQFVKENFSCYNIDCEKCKETNFLHQCLQNDVKVYCEEILGRGYIDRRIDALKNENRKLKQEIEQLKEHIEKMKCCGNCKYYYINDEDEFDCCRSYNCTKFDKWELAE